MVEYTLETGLKCAAVFLAVYMLWIVFSAWINDCTPARWYHRWTSWLWDSNYWPARLLVSVMAALVYLLWNLQL